ISIDDVDQFQASFSTDVTGAEDNLGSLDLGSDGSYTYTVDNAAVQNLGDSESRSDTFTETALDGTTKDVEFTINGANDDAVIGDTSVPDVTADRDDKVVDSGPTRRATDLISIDDVDQYQASFSTGVTGAEDNLGSLVLQADGSYTYTVDNGAVQYL